VSFKSVKLLFFHFATYAVAIYNDFKLLFKVKYLGWEGGTRQLK